MDSHRMEILVAIDFTECSDAALDAALGLASRLGATLELVHVAEAPAASPVELMTHSADGGRIREARTALAKLVQRAADRGIEARTQVLVGPARFGLLEEIDRVQPALVVVGSHGKGFLGRTLLGSVSEALCRRSARPVLVIPSPRRHQLAKELARSCEACGHILEAGESVERCAGCDASPVRWLSAPISHAAADTGLPAVADGVEDRLAYERTNDPAGLFPTSPGGTEGYDVNPELRVRY